MQTSYPFLSSARTDAWLRHKGAPLQLTGTMVKRVKRSDQWVGLELSPSVRETRSAGRCSQRRWEEYVNAKRTLQPDYSQPHFSRSHSEFSLLSASTPTHFHTKSVLCNGKILHSNSSSSSNLLNTRNSDQYRGLSPFQRTEKTVRKSKGVSVYHQKLSLSQITGLPGRSQTPNSLFHSPKPSRKNTSQIDCLGGCFTPPSPPTQPDTAGHMRRNLETSFNIDVSDRKSPIKSHVPRRLDLVSYRKVGQEAEMTRKLKTLIPVKVQKQTETLGTGRLKPRPATITDQFTPSFRLF